MDPRRFDSLARSLTGSSSRRGALASLLGGTLGLLGLADTGAKKRKKKGKKGKKGKKKGGNQSPPPTPPPAPTCVDGIKNGSESDIDCGGTCPRCANGKSCGSSNDCANACTGGTCQACTDNPDNCGSDARGACFCVQSEDEGPFVCRTNSSGFIVDGSCASSPCPAGMICVFFDSDESFCFTPCGAP